MRTVCRHHSKDSPASGPSWASTSRAQSRCLIDPKAVPARLSLGSKSETERSDTFFGGLVEFRPRRITRHLHRQVCAMQEQRGRVPQQVTTVRRIARRNRRCNCRHQLAGRKGRGTVAPPPPKPPRRRPAQAEFDAVRQPTARAVIARRSRPPLRAAPLPRPESRGGPVAGTRASSSNRSAGSDSRRHRPPLSPARCAAPRRRTAETPLRGAARTTSSLRTCPCRRRRAR